MPSFPMDLRYGVLIFTLSFMIVWTPAASRQLDCVDPLDLVFVVHASPSVLEKDYGSWTKMKNFLVDFTHRFTISPGDTRVGLTSYGIYARPSFYLNRYDNAADIDNAILQLSLHPENGSIDAGVGLFVAYDSILSIRNGDRINVANVAVVITDEASNHNTHILPRYAANLKNDAIVVAVGVTSYVSSTELKLIATDQNLIFKVPDFDGLSENVNSMVDTVCRFVEESVPETATPDSATPTPTLIIVGSVLGLVCTCLLVGLFVFLGIYLYKKRKRMLAEGREENGAVPMYERHIISTVTGQQRHSESDSSNGYMTPMEVTERLGEV